MTPETRKKLQEVANRTPRTSNGTFTEQKPKSTKPKKPKEEQPPRADPVPIDVYFVPANEKFWMKEASGEWIPVNKGTLDLKLRDSWYSQYEKATNGLTQVERKMLEIIMHHSVKFAGEVAGWQQGLHVVSGNRVLISKGPNIPTPKRGAWPLLRKFIHELLGPDARYFYSWMLAAFQSLRAGPPFAPGQVLAVAGPSGCGKSLLQRLITVMIGGRMGKPYDYLMGETTFNDTMIGSEHLVLDDEVGKADIRTRRHFGAKLKATVANQEVLAHPKGKGGFTIEPFWRISISLNDEPECLMVLPPIDNDIADKVVLLRAFPASFPYPSEKMPTRQAYWEALIAEVPAYLHALLRWSIPEDLRDLRYGVQAYQNPELMFALSSLSPETKLWSLILQAGILSNYNATWTGTASDLEVELQKSPVHKQVEDMLYYSTACGTYLSRLAKSQPKNVEKEIVGGNKTVFHLWNDSKPPL